MKRKTVVLGVCCLGLGLSQLAFADDVTEQKPNGSKDVQTSIDSKAKEGTKSLCLSKLIGVNVTDKDGTNLGTVQDVVINPHTGKIRFALVGQGFMAGTGETIFPVPWQAVKVQPQQQFVLNVDKQKLKSAPAWSETQLEQPDYVIHIYRFYELEPEDAAGGVGNADEQSGQGKGSSESNQQKNEPPQESQPDK